MIAELQEAGKSFGEQEIFRGATARIHEGDRIGLVGPNGTGKSTLLSVLLGDLEADDGTVSRRSGVRIGYLKQNTGLEAQSTIIDEMRSVFSDALKAQERMNELTAQMEREPENTALQKAYDAQMAVFLAADGYQIDVKIRRILAGMGFAGTDEKTQIATMSGGEKTRLALAKLLLTEPELLVLDEPTNHLDMETLAWLEEYLGNYRGAILVVSHDRFFLDRVVTRIWELDSTQLYTYRGNYTKYKTLRQERLETQAKEYEKQQNQIQSLQDYVDRNSVRASTAQMAKSREQQLEKLVLIDKPKLNRRPPHFAFQAGRRAGQEVLDVSALRLSVDGGRRELVADLNLNVRRGDFLAVIGANGTGKSTLLKSLLAASGHPDPAIAWGRNVSIGYYDQENRDLRPEASVVSELMRHCPGMLESQARSLLGSVRLTGDDVFKNVGDLSGGERAKLGLAVLMAGDANVLLLDEPTNHLDLEAREALEEALKAYEGTLIFVSHDRYFINALAERVLAFSGGQTDITEGNYDDYRAAHQPAEEKPLQANAAAASKGSMQKAARRRQAEQRQALYEAEQRISALEKEIAALNETIAASSDDYETLQEACGRLEEVTALHDEALEEWMMLDDARGQDNGAS
ncbi:MAG: ATP-binding cassette domain-containing protein [Clostridia bacterium]|nr:ATP-binding cassette domain-containing protein [Clostridia bacterium]